MDQLIDAVQWPAMVVTLIAAWLVASERRYRRRLGFWCFLASNLLWILWGWHDGAPALLALQIGLFTMNLRGAKKTQEHREDDDPDQR